MNIWVSKNKSFHKISVILQHINYTYVIIRLHAKSTHLKVLLDYAIRMYMDVMLDNRYMDFLYQAWTNAVIIHLDKKYPMEKIGRENFEAIQG